MPQIPSEPEVIHLDNINLNAKQHCDNLILSDSILRRINPRRFSPREKTILRFIRGGVKTCASFILNNGTKFAPRRVLVHIGTRDLQQSDVNADNFRELFTLLTTTWPESEIYLLPILKRKDIQDNVVREANNTIQTVGDEFSKVKILDIFEPLNDMFHDNVHLSDHKGLPAVVKHLKVGMKISLYDQTKSDSRKQNRSPQQALPVSHEHVNRDNSIPKTNVPTCSYVTPPFNQSPLSVQSNMQQFQPVNIPSMPQSVHVPPMPQSHMPFYNPWLWNPFDYGQWQVPPQVPPVPIPFSRFNG